MTSLFSSGVLQARNWGVRIFALAFYFLAIIISTSYIANSIAALNSSTSRYQINSMSDFVTSGLHFCVEGQSNTQRFFLSSPDPLYQQASSLMVAKKDQSECMHALRSGQVAGYVTDSPLLSYVTNNQPCDTRIAGEPFDVSYYALPTAKNFTFRSQLDYLTSLLVETGVVADYVAQWNSSAGCDYIRSSNAAKYNRELSIDIPQLAGLWYILLVASACSIILIGIEWWLWSKREIPRLQPLRTFVGDRQIAKARRIHAK